MAFSVHASGTFTTTGGSFATENDLSDVTAPSGNVFQLRIDANGLASGDEVQLKCYQKVRSGGTLRVTWAPYLRGQRGDEKNVLSPYLIGMNNIKFSIQQTAGVSGRALEWDLLKQA